MSQLHDIKLADICTTRPVCVGESEPLHAVLAVMRRRRISSVIVVRDQRPLGLFTERDALALLAGGDDDRRRPVGGCMQSPPVTCAAHTSFLDGYMQLVRNGIRHLVLVDARGHVAGIVSETDVAASLDDADYLRPRRVGEVMVRDPPRLPPAAPVAAALTLLLERRLGVVLVAEGRRPVGILTERDVHRLYDGARFATKAPLSAVMTAPVLCIDAEAALSDADHRMRAAGVRRLAVVDQAGDLAGLITQHDLVKGLRERCEDLLRELLHEQTRELTRLRGRLSSEFVVEALLGREHAFGVVAADAAGVVRYANPAATALATRCGATVEDRPLRDLIAALGGDDEAFGRLLAGLGSDRGARWEITADGGRRVLACDVSAVADAGNGVAGYLMLLNDVTALAESDQRFRRIFEVAPSAIAITRLSDGIVIDVNPACTALSGYAPEQIVGRDSIGIGAWVDPEVRAGYLAAIAAGRPVHALQAEFRRQDGVVLQTLINGDLLHLRGESCALSVITDITAQSRYLAQIEHQHGLFNAVFQSLADALLIIAEDGCIVMANDACARLFGRPPEALVTRPLAELFADAEQWRGLLAKAARPAPAVLACVGRDGVPFPGEVLVTPVRDAGDEGIGTLVSVRDVSRRERQRRLLEANERRLQDLIDTMADWVWEVDAGGRYTYVSDQVQQVLGYAPAALLGRTPFELMPADEAPGVAAAFGAIAAAAGPFQNLENTCLHRDGSPRILSTSGVPILAADGTLLGYRGVDRDVTEERQAAERVRASEAQLQAIFDNANVGIMMLTGGRVLARANRRMAEILGYDGPEQMVGLGMRAVHLSEERFVEFGRRHYQALRYQDQRHLEYQLRRRDGSAVWCLISGAAVDTAVPADLGRGVIWTAEDITELKRKEADLRALNARLSEEHELFTSGPTMVFRWLPAPGWPVAYCSPNVERMLGIAAADLTAGRVPYADCIHPDDLPRIAGEVQAHTEAGAEDFEQEYRLRGAGGDWRHFYDYTRVLRDDAGGVVGYHGYLVDITEQRRREAELRALMDAIPDLIFFKDADGRYLDCNLAFTRFIGRPRAQVIGITDWDLFPPDIAAFFRDRDAEMLAGRRARRNEEWVAYPDGNRALLDTLKTPYARAPGAPLGVLGISRDITRQHWQGRDLERAQALAGIGSGYQELRTGRTYWSPNLFRILGLDPEHARAGVATLLSLVHEDDVERVRRTLLELPRGERTSAVTEFRIRRPDGALRWIDSRRELIRDATGAPVRIEGIAQDITERRRAELALAESEERYRSMFENTNEGIMITDADNRIVSVNPAFTAITGYSESEVRGRRPGLLRSGRQDRGFYQALWAELNETGSWRGEIWNRRKDGELFAEWLSISLIRNADGSIRNHIGIFSDITQARRSEEAIEHLTHYDVLTGLPNLVLLRARLDQALQSALVAGRPLAVMMINLDGFKRVVSSLGHEAADRVLATVAQRLHAPLPADATLARTIGDSFTLVLELEQEDSPSRVALRLQQALRDGVEVPEVGRLVTGCCVGIALYPSDADGTAELLRDAEAALHRAKAAGPGSIAYYRPEMTAAATRRIALEQALRQAVQRDELELHYQPKLDLQAAAIVGAEALIRWRRPGGGLVPPKDFMGVVESSDLVHDVGRWVIREAARTLRHWHDTGLAPVRVSVNVSGAMITAGGLAEVIAAVTAEAGIDASELEIEVLENILFEDPVQAEAELRSVRALGVHIALDDFGTGYSSLGYLKRFPFDVLKIDRGFIGGLRPNSDDMAIVRSTISMAHHLGIRVVAEGVCNDGQIDQLAALGCDLLQGYRIGRPVPRDDFAALLSADGMRALADDLAQVVRRRVLLAGIDAAAQRRMADVLQGLGWAVVCTASAADTLDLLAHQHVYLLLVGEALADGDAVALLEQAKRLYPEVVRVLVAAAPATERVVDAVNRAAIFRVLPVSAADADLAELLRAGYQFAGLLRRAGLSLTARQH